MKASCPACGGSTACGDPTGLRKDEQRILELANVAMEELIRMTQIREPLWLPSLDNSSFSVVLNEEEYLRKFPSDFALRTTAQKSEGSLAVAAVRMSPIKLAEILLDVVSLLLGCFFLLIGWSLDSTSPRDLSTLLARYTLCQVRSNNSFYLLKKNVY